MPGNPHEWVSHSKDGLWSIAQASDRLRPTGNLPDWAPTSDDVGTLSQVRRDLAENRCERRGARTDYWLRCLGYVTRSAVYFGPLVLLAWWFWPYAVAFSRSPGSLAITDYLLIGGCVVGFFGAVIPLILFFFNVDGDPIQPIDWEDWGRVGLGLLPVAALGVLWLGSLP